VHRTETLPLVRSDDLIEARQIVRGWARELGFSRLDQTRLVTATSELARNVIRHGGGGELVIAHATREDGQRGLSLQFVDAGGGIADIDEALVDGYSTGGGLGLGLGGARRLSQGFEIESSDSGTRITITRWTED